MSRTLRSALLALLLLAAIALAFTGATFGAFAVPGTCPTKTSRGT